MDEKNWRSKKFGPNWVLLLKYWCHGQMSSGQMLSGQMSPWRIESAKCGWRNLPLKFGQNWFSYSWDITHMDKCHQAKYCLDKCHHDSWHLLKIVSGIYLWILVKILTVTAEIFLIWTNVAKTNVAWTNVTMIVGIC